MPLKVEDILTSTANITKVDLMLGTEGDAAKTELGKSMANLEGLFQGINDGRGLLNALVHDEGMANSIRRTAANLDRSTAGMARIMDEVETGDGLAHEMVYGGEDGLAVEMRALASSLGQLTEDIQNKDSMINALIYDADKVAILDDLQETVNSLKRTSAALENGQGSLACSPLIPRSTRISGPWWAAPSAASCSGLHSEDHREGRGRERQRMDA